jgi:hypothetical protein
VPDMENAIYIKIKDCTKASILNNSKIFNTPIDAVKFINLYDYKERIWNICGGRKFLILLAIIMLKFQLRGI